MPPISTRRRQLTDSPDLGQSQPATPVAPPFSGPLGYYAPSGRFNVVNTITALAAGLLAAVVVGAIEGAAAWYIPIIYLTIAAPIGLGFAIGWVSLVLLRWSRVRNTAVSLAFTAILALASLYAAWAVWLALVLPAGLRDELGFWKTVWMVATQPLEMLDLMRMLAEDGVWSLGRSQEPVKGLFLMACWLAEAGLVFGIAVVVARRQMQSLPFCEECLQWAEGRYGAARLGVSDPDTLARRLEAGELAALEELGPADLALPRRTVVDVFRCPVCRSFNTLRVDDLVLSVNKEGQLQENRRPIARDLLISGQQAQWVEQVGQRLGVVDSEEQPQHEDPSPDPDRA